MPKMTKVEFDAKWQVIETVNFQIYADELAEANEQVERVQYSHIKRIEEMNHEKAKEAKQNGF
jgi:hypothetical protein